MHENQVLDLIRNLRKQIENEMDNARERLWESERYMMNCLDTAEDKVLESIKAMDQETNRLVEEFNRRAV